MSMNNMLMGALKEKEEFLEENPLFSNLTKINGKCDFLSSTLTIIKP